MKSHIGFLFKCFKYFKVAVIMRTREFAQQLTVLTELHMNRNIWPLSLLLCWNLTHHITELWNDTTCQPPWRAPHISVTQRSGFEKKHRKHWLLRKKTKLEWTSNASWHILKNVCWIPIKDKQTEKEIWLQRHSYILTSLQKNSAGLDSFSFEWTSAVSVLNLRVWNGLFALAWASFFSRKL